MPRIDQLFPSATDTAEEGTWVTVRPGVDFKVRSLQSVIVRREQIKLARKNRPAIIQSGGLLDPELEDETDVTLCVRVVVLDWRGVDGDDGKAIPFTKDSLKKLLEKYPALRREIMYHARADETFKAGADGEREAIAGN